MKSNMVSLEDVQAFLARCTWPRGYSVQAIEADGHLSIQARSAEMREDGATPLIWKEAPVLADLGMGAVTLAIQMLSDCLAREELRRGFTFDGEPLLDADDAMLASGPGHDKACDVIQEANAS